MRYDIKDIKAVMDKNGYAFFTNGQYNLNIIGVRSDNTGTNEFDDVLIVAFKDSTDTLVIHEFPITTDPGAHWLTKPLSPKGTAILVAGQYRGAYQIAKHQGKYEALCQRKPVTVYRDNDKDEELDFKPESKEKGMFGINIHRSNPYGKSYRIDKWSAGCQVFQNKVDFDLLMGLAKKAAELYGNSFTYTLLTEEEVNELKKTA